MAQSRTLLSFLWIQRKLSDPLGFYSLLTKRASANGLRLVLTAQSLPGPNNFPAFPHLLLTLVSFNGTEGSNANELETHGSGPVGGDGLGTTRSGRWNGGWHLGEKCSVRRVGNVRPL